MQPLNVLAVRRVPDSRLAENMLFHALRAFRVNQRHEVFAPPSVRVLQQAFDLVAAFFATSADAPPPALALASMPPPRPAPRVTHVEPPPLALYLRETLETDKLATSAGTGFGPWRQSTAMFEQFLAWKRERSSDADWTIKRFGTELTHYDGLRKAKKHGIMSYRIEIQVLQRALDAMLPGPLCA